jgi:hypothetical protein
MLVYFVATGIIDCGGLARTTFVHPLVLSSATIGTANWDYFDASIL